MRMFSMLVGMVLVGCSQSVRPPVVDASWRASPDDRLVISDGGRVESSTLSQSDNSRIDEAARPDDAKADARDAPVSAVTTLLAKADRAVQEGARDEALGHLERAQRIEPQRAEIYVRLAYLRLDQGRTQVALEIARQGLEFPDATGQTRRSLYDVIARAENARGNAAAAAEARRLRDQ